jgi:hypothetical protein
MRSILGDMVQWSQTPQPRQVRELLFVVLAGSPGAALGSGAGVAVPAPVTAAAWQPRPLASSPGSDAVPSAQEVMAGDRAARLAARAVGQGRLRPWHATAAGYLAVLKDMVVDHRAEKCWLAALVARQEAEVR